MTRQKQDNHWYINSGATKHLTFEKDLIVDFITYKQLSKIYRVIEAYGQGKVRLFCYDETDALELTLYKLLYVPCMYRAPVAQLVEHWLSHGRS